MRAQPFLPTGYNPQASSAGGFGQPHNIMFQPPGLSGGVGPNLTGGQGGGNPIMQFTPPGLTGGGQPGLTGGGPGLTGGGDAPGLTGNGGNPIMQVNPQGPDLSGGGTPQTPFGPQVGFGPQPSTPQQGFTPYMYRLPGIPNQSAKSPLINAMLRDLA